MTALEIIEDETGHKVTEATPIEALEVDSLEFVNLLLTLGNHFGKEIPDSKWGELVTVGDILRELA